MSGFDEGLFGCTGDWFSCCVGCNGGVFLIAESVNRVTDDGFWMPCLISYFLCCFGAAIERGKIRAKYGIEGTYLTDCLTMWCCGACGSCQMWREVMKREGLLKR